MQGLHLIADFYRCTCSPTLLTGAEALAGLCRSHTREIGLNIVDEKWHSFPSFLDQPGGVTGVLLLAESHLAVHTWPERGGVTLDVYVCNFSEDNTEKAERLMRELEVAFRPGKLHLQRLRRGDENP